jgi:hypothetical protein
LPVKGLHIYRTAGQKQQDQYGHYRNPGTGAHLIKAKKPGQIITPFFIANCMANRAGLLQYLSFQPLSQDNRAAAFLLKNMLASTAVCITKEGVKKRLRCRADCRFS